ncbi:MAG: hypothetical protein K2L19_04275 [Eubacterium sp.]|nr:hypothetical protein [Eubacterium sp.]
MDIFEELWFGSTLISNQICNEAEYKKLLNKMSDCSELLRESLFENEMELYKNFEDALEEYSYFTDVYAFKMGFRVCIEMFFDINFLNNKKA